MFPDAVIRCLLMFPFCAVMCPLDDCKFPYADTCPTDAVMFPEIDVISLTVVNVPAE